MSLYSGLESVSLVVADEIRFGDLVAERISDPMQWGEGAIRPIDRYNNVESQRALIQAVMHSLVEVSDTEAGMSGCTDGRRPIRLLSGDAVPARKQLVGGNLVSGFYVAEALGELGLFYSDPSAPVDRRVNEVAEFLHDNGKKPSGHINCGAGAGFAVVSASVPRFAQHELYVARSQFFLPSDVYDSGLHATMLRGNQRRAERADYAALRPEMFVSAIERVSGTRALAELNDDGRGQHGHVEEDIIRMRVGNHALDEARLAAATGNREVFVVNDDEMDSVASVFEIDSSIDRHIGRIARMAIEDFANAGHGTLARGLPTWRIQQAS